LASIVKPKVTRGRENAPTALAVYFMLSQTQMYGVRDDDSYLWRDNAQDSLVIPPRFNRLLSKGPPQGSVFCTLDRNRPFAARRADRWF